MSYKLGSLFDGSGGFPLAGALCGIEPVWASEVEPYPIAVTRERFPRMKHLGDISKINGAEIEPVDIITFGSPCQDLSVAGKRAGLKHEANGDEETTRSGLFMEAVRIIKEMRTATNGQYPRFALWENVPGAFSSNKGEDFRIVCEELIKIVESSAFMPPVPQNGWNYADSYIGDGWSLAYRVFDAQYWGVPQRRRRIHLVVDFRGERAREVLFEREGVRGYFTEGGTPWQTTPCDTQGGSGTDDREGEGFDGYNGALTGDKTATLGINYGISTGRNGVIERERHRDVMSVHLLQDPITGGEVTPCLSQGSSTHGQACLGVAYSFDSLASNSMKSKNPRSGCRAVDIAKALDTTDPNPSKNQGGIAIVQPVICLQGAGATSQNAQGMGWRENTAYTLNTTDVHGVVQLASGEKTVDTLCAGPAARGFSGNQEIIRGSFHVIESHSPRCAGVDCRNGTENPEKTATLQAACDHNLNSNNVVRGHYIVRRLTPTECARLQGFADWWGRIEPKNNLSDEECRFWLEVRNTHAAINGKETKDYTKAQMLTWYNKLWTDSAEYKMWGNGIALPPALYCMQGIMGALNGRQAQVDSIIAEHKNEEKATDNAQVICMATQQGGAEIRIDNKAPTLTAAAGMSGNNQPVVCYIEPKPTDLSDAPEEIKAEIIKNAEKLEELETIKETTEETMELKNADEQTTVKENTPADFCAVAQLRRLAEERKALANLRPEDPRFSNDVQALEYAANVLEAVGL